LVFEPGELHEIVGDDSVFICGWLIATPPEGPTFPASNEQTMDGIHGMVKWVAMEVGLGWDNLGITLAHILKDT
jgi:hypothetical protein